MTAFSRLCVFSIVALFASVTGSSAQQTIVFFRHGEKPSSGNGQLTCQGLNRALALPDVLFAKFGRPHWAYAPNPSQKIPDPAGSFFYVRPLATIEPSVIRAGISVNTNYGYTNVSGLQSVLIRSSKANSTIYVAWEHAYLVKAVQSIMNAYGGGVRVPAWISGDYDTLYVVRVNYTSSGIRAWFELDSQGLNGLPTTCR